jgi:hypothetical protein
MPNDLALPTVTGANAGGDGPAAARVPAAEPPPLDHAGPTASPTPNPTLELDAALGLVVIQFRNDSGAVTNSIPSQQQLDAYRQWQDTRVGTPPSLGLDAPAPAVPGAGRKP